MVSGPDATGTMPWCVFDTGTFGTMMSHYGVGYRIQRAEVHGEDLSIYLDMTRGPRVEGYEKGRAFSVEARGD